VKAGKFAYLSHVMHEKRYHMLQLQGKIQGKQNVGRRRTLWLKNWTEWYHYTSSSRIRSKNCHNDR